MNPREHRFYFQVEELHPRLREVLQRETSRAPLKTRPRPQPTRVQPAKPVLTRAEPVTVPAFSKTPAAAPALTGAAAPSQTAGNAEHHNTTAVNRETPQPRELEAKPPQPESSVDRQPYSRPRLSVHALGQFAFCSRAGVIASESTDESEPEEPSIRLGYLPNYDLALIEEEIAKRVRIGLLLVGAMTCLLAGIVYALRNHAVLLLQIGIVLSTLLAKALTDASRDLLILVYRRQQALQSEPIPLLEEISRNTRVNWWALLKSGFEANSYPQPMLHPELPLEGNPWRVLHYGSLRIPVIRSGSRELGSASGEVFPKHQVRLVAYALLLGSVDHIRVPYGIVLPAHSPWGIAVPITPELTQQARSFLEHSVNLANWSASGESSPDIPANKSLCRACVHGKPSFISVPQIMAAKRQSSKLLVMTNRQGAFFHCVCGDRFGSAPPHEVVLRKKLTALIE